MTVVELRPNQAIRLYDSILLISPETKDSNSDGFIAIDSAFKPLMNDIAQHLKIIILKIKKKYKKIIILPVIILYVLCDNFTKYCHTRLANKYPPSPLLSLESLVNRLRKFKFD